MPRYRFAWNHFSPRLLKKLVVALNLDGDPAEALRRRYGARPKTDFIQDAWPTLLAAWLPADTAARELLVETLRDGGLGKTDASVRSKRGQLDYLGSCRNAPKLRGIVLAAFLAAGEPTQMEAPSVRSVPSAQEPPRARSERGDETDSSGGSAGTGQATAAKANADLDEWIVVTLKEAFGLLEVERDADGDIPIPRGSSALFIRPHDGESPFLEIFAPILQRFQMSSDVYEAVNAINAQVPMAKATVSGDGTMIVLSAQLLTDTLSSAELLLAIDLVSGAADHFDTLLQKRFGGDTFLEDDDDAIEV